MNSEIRTRMAPLQDRPGIKSQRKRWMAGLFVVGALLAVGIAPRISRTTRAVAAAPASTPATPAVNGTVAVEAPAIAEVLLPGATEAERVASVFARATGYVRERYVDIGDKVRAGQLLALIETPEVSQELSQARAALEESRAAAKQARATLERAKASVDQAQANIRQAEANQEIAGATYSRWSRLVKKGVLSQQEGDEKESTFNARKAEVAAAEASVATARANVTAVAAAVDAADAAVRVRQANVERLQQLVAFNRVTAPFDGVITARGVERGDLVVADAGATGRSLFTVAQIDALRIQVNVPQTFAPDIKHGLSAQVLVKERPGRAVAGIVARTASSLDPTSRTLRVEVTVQNRDGLLLPGMYAQVQFALPRSKRAVIVPAAALISGPEGIRVAVVTPSGNATFRKIAVERDLGAEVEVTEGLEAGELLVANPPESLTEGQRVEVRNAGKHKPAKS